MTIEEIRSEMKPVKPISRERLYFYFRKFKIKPLGRVRMVPQNYPNDTAARMLSCLGLKTSKRARR